VSRIDHDRLPFLDEIHKHAVDQMPEEKEKKKLYDFFVFPVAVKITADHHKQGHMENINHIIYIQHRFVSRDFLEGGNQMAEYDQEDHDSLDVIKPRDSIGIHWKTSRRFLDVQLLEYKNRGKKKAGGEIVKEKKWN
jgi:hypothetical protein